MHQSAGDRGQGADCTQNNSQNIDADRQGDVGPDGCHHAAGQGNESGQPADIRAHQGDRRRLDGDVAAQSAHGDRTVGRGQSRCVVDAVADHADVMAFSAHLLDFFELLVGHERVLIMAQADRVGNAGRGGAVVACQHDGRNAERAQCGNGLARFRAQNIRYGEQTCQPAVDDNGTQRFALLQPISPHPTYR